MSNNYQTMTDNNPNDKSLTDCPVIKPIHPDHKKQKKMDGREKALCGLYIALLVVIIVMIMWGMIFETSKIGETISYLSDLIDNAVNSDNIFLSCVVYLVAQLLFHLLWVPGLTFFNALIGYYMHNTWLAFLAVYIPSVISCFITYFVARYIFRNWCLKSFLKQRVFRAFFKESAKTPWKTSALVRCMFIPVATKNYLMPLLNINFVQYAIPAALFYIPYLGAMVLVGANLNNIAKVAEKDGWEKMNAAEKFQYIFTMFLMVLTVLILVWFAFLTCKKYKELKKEEEAEEKEKMQAEGVVVDIENDGLEKRLNDESKTKDEEQVIVR